jgi:hypothetical protein
MMIVQIITFDTWSDIMYDLMDAFSAYVWVYFLLVAMLGGFFVVQLFLAVVFEEFMKSKENNAAVEEEALAKEAAEHGEEMKQTDDYAKLTGEGEAEIKGGIPFLREIVESTTFQYGTMLMLVCNMVVMCMPYAGQPAEYGLLIETLTAYFTVLFVIEMALKFVAVGVKDFFAQGWNIFDTTLLLVSVADLLLTEFVKANEDANFNVMYFRVLRMVRVLRMLRIMKSWDGLFRIFMCLLVVDGQTGKTVLDEQISAFLRRQKVPVVLAVNKCESTVDGAMQAADFWSLGLGNPFPVSGLHGTGMGDVMDELIKPLPPPPEEGEGCVLRLLMGR